MLSAIIQINRKTDSSFTGQVLKAGELGYSTDLGELKVGDGTQEWEKLTSINTALTYIPEDSSNKGQADGYVPLDSQSKINSFYLPDGLVSGYTKAEVDALLLSLSNTLTTAINNEATAREADVDEVADDLTTHINNSNVHVTVAEKTAWDAKLDEEDLQPFEDHIADDDIHVTLEEKSRWDGNIMVYVKASVAEMNAIPKEQLNTGDVCYIDDGSGTLPRYVYLAPTQTWAVDNTTAQLMELRWGNIKEKPLSSVENIDLAVGARHTHANKPALDKIGEDPNGNLTYDGIPIGANVTFYADNTLLPATGDIDHFYVCYADGRVKNYASISLWKDGAFQILGKGYSDSPTPIGDFEVVQHEFYSVVAGFQTSLTLETPNEDFAYLDVNILKMIPGEKNKTLLWDDFTDSSKYTYDEVFITVENGVKVNNSVSYDMTQTASGSGYYMYEQDVDLSNWSVINEIT